MPEKPEKNESDVVAKTVEAVMATLAPILKEISLSPEKIEAIRRPWVDPNQAETERKLREQMANDEKRGRAKNKAVQDACAKMGHRHPQDPTKNTVNIIRNFHDGQSRGICQRCLKIIQPLHWEIYYDDKDPNGRRVAIPEDEDYYIVRQLESTGANSGFGTAI